MHLGEDKQVVQCGRAISVSELEAIKETVETLCLLSRKEVALTICEHLGWYSFSGSLKVDACMKLLEKLESQGYLRLPPKQAVPGCERRRVYASERTVPGTAMECSLKELGTVRLEGVRGRQETEIWNEYVHRYHYLGYKQPFGCFARYFVESDHGKLGCVLFSGSAKSLRARDRWIGWSEGSRVRNLGRIVNNTRFVIFPWVRVKNLASHVLAQAVRRIAADWEERWSYRPVLLETFVDPRYFDGTCYRAANWQYLGMTTGVGLVRKGRSYTTSPKKIFVKPLVDDFRTLLCS
jgi:hypothetical protein